MLSLGGSLIGAGVVQLEEPQNKWHQPTQTDRSVACCHCRLMLSVVAAVGGGVVSVVGVVVGSGVVGVVVVVACCC